jgi:hypothetical protein
LRWAAISHGPCHLCWPASHLKIETQAKKFTNQGTNYREASCASRVLQDN